MKYTPEKTVLVLRPDSVDYVLQSMNLSRPGELEDAIKTLREWVDMQPHFKRKDFTDNVLKSTIIVSKGSIEAAKQRLDKICTLRTLLPDCFRYYDVRKDFGNLFEVMKPIVLPQLTKNQCRVFTVKIYGEMESSHISNGLKYTLLIGDYMKQCDIICNFIGIFDLTQIHLLDLVTKLNLTDLKHTLTAYFEGHGMRLKGIYFVTTSKLIDSLITLLRQVLKPKIVERIKVFKSWDEIHDVIEQKILPVDFGGNEKSEKEIHDEWIEALSSEDFGQYLRDINSAGTDESCRPSHKFSEEYAGMPGTFRVLSVD